MIANTNRSLMKLLGVIALSAAALASGCQMRQAPDDGAITRNVKAKLTAAFGRFEDRQVSQFDRGATGQTITYISVKSTGGVVTLTGEVADRKIRDRAATIARSVPEVTKVQNQLSLAPGYSDDAGTNAAP